MNRKEPVHAEGVVRRTVKCKSKRASLFSRDFTAITCPACLAAIRKDLRLPGDP